MSATLAGPALVIGDTHKPPSVDRHGLTGLRKLAIPWHWVLDDTSGELNGLDSDLEAGYDLEPEDIEEDQPDSPWTIEAVDYDMSETEEVLNFQPQLQPRMLRNQRSISDESDGEEILYPRNLGACLLTSRHVVPTSSPNVALSLLRGTQEGWSTSLDDEVTAEALRKLDGISKKTMARALSGVHRFWRASNSSCVSVLEGRSSDRWEDINTSDSSISKRDRSIKDSSPAHSSRHKTADLSTNIHPAPLTLDDPAILPTSPVRRNHSKRSMPSFIPFFRRSPLQSMQMPPADDALSPNSPSLLLRVRRGYWNRRGDYLTPGGYIVHAPSALAYPEELSTYPPVGEGYLNHRGTFLGYAERPELPESLPRRWKAPDRPYESFVTYVDKDRMTLLDSQASFRRFSTDSFPNGITLSKHITRRPSQEKAVPHFDTWDLDARLAALNSRRPKSPTSSSSSYVSAHSTRSRASSWSGSAQGYIPGTTRDVKEFPFGYPITPD